MPPKTARINELKDLIKDRENMLKRYKDDLSELPKGTLTVKTINGCLYYYRSYRDGSKVGTEYLGKDFEKIRHVKQTIERRKALKQIVRQIQQELLDYKKKIRALEKS